MRDAGFARRLVGAAGLVPDHVRDDRGAVVGDDDDLHAVVEHEIADFGVCRTLGRAGKSREGKRCDDKCGGKRSLPIAARGVANAH